MKQTLLGRKVGMTQVFDEDGTVHPVTVVELGPCPVLQVKTLAKDGYNALQIGFGSKREKSTIRAERGHAAKAGVAVPEYVKEVRLGPGEEPEQAAGDVLTAELFNDVARVDVVGTMKGRGYAGVMKRHQHGGLEATHGVQRKHRAGGSIGMSAYPSRVIKGMKMHGQYGNCRDTVRNLRVVRVDVERNLVLLRGSVPGPNGGFVMVRKTNKRRPSEG